MVARFDSQYGKGEHSKKAFGKKSLKIPYKLESIIIYYILEYLYIINLIQYTYLNL